MTDRDLLNERKCEECGQVTMTRDWQDVNFCGSCGVSLDDAERDGGEHIAVGMSLSADEVDQLVDGEEVSLTRVVDDEHRLTVQLVKSPP